MAFEMYLSWKVDWQKELLIWDKSTTIHQKNLRVVAVEMYKISHNMSPIFMEDLVTEIDTKYHTRSSYKVELDDNCKFEKVELLR